MVEVDEMKDSIQLGRFFAVWLMVKITAERDFFGLAEIIRPCPIEADVEKLRLRCTCPTLQQDPVTLKREEPLPRERLDPASRDVENQLVFDLIGREFQPN